MYLFIGLLAGPAVGGSPPPVLSSHMAMQEEYGHPAQGRLSTYPPFPQKKKNQKENDYYDYDSLSVNLGVDHISRG